ncbi:MAG: hypothetical protein NTY08_07365 [Proteobacteria bacterium]|nr:hypothetical protein [Pseudomonadota bacterium]
MNALFISALTLAIIVTFIVPVVTRLIRSRQQNLSHQDNAGTQTIAEATHTGAPGPCLQLLDDQLVIWKATLHRMVDLHPSYDWLGRVNGRWDTLKGLSQGGERSVLLRQNYTDDPTPTSQAVATDSYYRDLSEAVIAIINFYAVAIARAYPSVQGGLLGPSLSLDDLEKLNHVLRKNDSAVQQSLAVIAVQQKICLRLFDQFFKDTKASSLIGIDFANGAHISKAGASKATVHEQYLSEHEKLIEMLEQFESLLFSHLDDLMVTTGDCVEEAIVLIQETVHVIAMTPLDLENLLNEFRGAKTAVSSGLENPGSFWGMIVNDIKENEGLGLKTYHRVKALIDEAA